MMETRKMCVALFHTLAARAFGDNHADQFTEFWIEGMTEAGEEAGVGPDIWDITAIEIGLVDKEEV